MGTPGKKLVWPASPATAGRLYPAIPFEDLQPTPAKSAAPPQCVPDPLRNSPTPIKTKGKERAGAMEEKALEDKKAMKEKGPFAGTPARVAALKKPVDVPDMFSPAKPSTTPNTSGSLKKAAGRVSAAQDKPFLFGSPLPQHKMSNKDFDAAAASVLEEMNKRLADAGVKPVEKKILDSKPSDVFGAIERDAQTVSRATEYDAVVTVRGPSQYLVVREKEQMGPVWINQEQQKFPLAPSYLTVLTSAPIEDITSPQLRQRQKIGIRAIIA